MPIQRLGELTNDMNVSLTFADTYQVDVSKEASDESDELPMTIWKDRKFSIRITYLKFVCEQALRLVYTTAIFTKG